MHGVAPTTRSRALLLESAKRPFDLERGSPLRALLVERGEGEHDLLLTFHHVVVDEWSIEVLLRELGVLYRSARAGVPADLPPPALQMPDVAAVAPRSGVARGVGAVREAQESDLPPPLGAVSGPVSRRFEVDLPPGWAARLSAGAGSEGVTPFELALAGFLLLVRRLTGRDRVTVGTPRTLREGAPFEGLVGYLLEMVPAQAEFAGTTTLREVVTALRATCAPPTSPARPARGDVPSTSCSSSYRTPSSTPPSTV